MLPLRSAKLGGEETLLRAFFLKWIQEKRVIPVKSETGLAEKSEAISFKVIKKTDDFDTKLEAHIFCFA